MNDSILLKLQNYKILQTPKKKEFCLSGVCSDEYRKRAVT
jgi:hypothetical protein